MKTHEDRFSQFSFIVFCLNRDASMIIMHIFLTKNSSSRLNLDAPVTCPVCNENLPNKRHLNPHFKIAHPVDGACCVECLQASTKISKNLLTTLLLDYFLGYGCRVSKGPHKQNPPIIWRNRGTPLS